MSNYNDFNNNMGSNHTAGNDINQKFNKSNQNQIDKGINNINNNITVKINKTVDDYEYKELTEKELEKLNKEEKSQRYGMSKYCQQPVRCIGLLKDSIICDKTEIERSPVLNLIEVNNNNYLSDHINIERELVEDILNTEPYGVVTLIEIYGRVYKYGEGNDRYSIDPKALKNGYIRKLSDNIINPLETIDYGNNCNLTYEDLVDNEYWLQTKLNTNELKALISYLRNYINIITKNDLCEDFIYNYIINNYLLGLNQFDLYYKEIPDDKLNKNHYVELVYLLINIVVLLSKQDQIKINNLFQEIGKILLSFMGVKPILQYQNEINYIRFGESLGVKIGTMNFVVNNILKNLSIHPFDVYNKNILIKIANKFIKSQKQNLERKILDRTNNL